jgi:hypothetical protein
VCYSYNKQLDDGNMSALEPVNGRSDKACRMELPAFVSPSPPLLCYEAEGYHPSKPFPLQCDTVQYPAPDRGLATLPELAV